MMTFLDESQDNRLLLNIQATHTNCVVSPLYG